MLLYPEWLPYVLGPFVFAGVLGSTYLWKPTGKAWLLAEYLTIGIAALGA